MKVPPNNIAPINALMAPPAAAGRAMPTACRTNAAMSSVGRDHRLLAAAHSAADGAAASPTTIHALLPNHPGEFCPMAATRNVPAMMYPTPSRV
jgi:hypothetical protein